jgi:quercetin dioxygenase-like cupin family protein
MNEAEFEDYLAAEGYAKTGQSEYAADMDNAEHTHDFGFAALVISGHFHLVTPEGERTLGPGDVWSLEANVPHSEKVLDDAPVTFMYGIKS